jgi:serine/threonine-protein kinase
MEYVEGTSLAHRVEKQGPLPVAGACNFVRQAALGLHHAFEQGTVHRDIKPQNLMLTRKGQVKILDFGLARVARPESSDATLTVGATTQATAIGLTKSGMVLGTPDFIAPEQARDPHVADIRADIYSLGCTLYFLLAGAAPFPGGSAFEKMLAHVQDTPPPLAERSPDVPEAVVAVVARMMAKDPADRYQTPAEVAAALAPLARAATGRRPVHVTPATPLPPDEVPHPGREKRSITRARWLILGGGTVLALAVALLPGVRSSGWRRPAPAPASAAPDPVSPVAAAAVPRPEPAPEPIAPAATASSHRVLMVLAGPHFFNPDYGPVRRMLEAAGVEVRVASTRHGPLEPYRPGPGVPVSPDLLLSEARGDDFDAVVFVGGDVRPLLGKTQGALEAQRLVSELRRSPHKIVSAICRGTAVLADLGLLEGQSAAWNDYWPQEVGRSPGVAWSSEALVVSGPFITARDWDCAGALGEMLVDRLQGSPR